MKKKYEKPMVLFEDFTMSANIAGDCEGIVGNPSKGSCTVTSTGGITTFDGDMNICDFTPNQNDEFDGFCYHVPTEEHNLFNS